MSATIALCVPAYNAAWCLPRLLESAKKQEIPFDEILVYDDCSSDNTVEVARSHGATVIEGTVNVGCSAGKNTLLDRAQSDWIHFHDADDELLPNFTRLAHQWMSRGEACPDVVLFDYEYRDNDTNELILVRKFEGHALRNDAINYAIRNQINPFCGLYRRTRITKAGGYETDSEILYNEDVAFHCKLAVAGLSFDAEPEVSIINYRVGGSMSGANQLKCIQAHHTVMRRLAVQVSPKHNPAVACRLWHAAGILGSYGAWEDVDAALKLAQNISSRPPIGGLFAALCQFIGPCIAFRLRERMIRLFKPHLRTNLH